jgi:hypothetical protein
MQIISSITSLFTLGQASCPIFVGVGFAFKRSIVFSYKGHKLQLCLFTLGQAFPRTSSGLGLAFNGSRHGIVFTYLGYKLQRSTPFFTLGLAFVRLLGQVGPRLYWY